MSDRFRSDFCAGLAIVPLRLPSQRERRAVLAARHDQSLPSLEPAALDALLEEVEGRYVQQVLASSATLEEAASRLGIDPTTLWRKRKRWGRD